MAHGRDARRAYADWWQGASNSDAGSSSTAASSMLKGNDEATPSSVTEHTTSTNYQANRRDPTSNEYALPAPRHPSGGKHIPKAEAVIIPPQVKSHVLPPPSRKYELHYAMYMPSLLGEKKSLTSVMPWPLDNKGQYVPRVYFHLVDGGFAGTNTDDDTYERVFQTTREPLTGNVAQILIDDNDVSKPCVPGADSVWGAWLDLPHVPMNYNDDDNTNEEIMDDCWCLYITVGHGEHTAAAGNNRTATDAERRETCVHLLNACAASEPICMTVKNWLPSANVTRLMGVSERQWHTICPTTNMTHVAMAVRGETAHESYYHNATTDIPHHPSHTIYSMHHLAGLHVGIHWRQHVDGASISKICLHHGGSEGDNDTQLRLPPGVVSSFEHTGLADADVLEREAMEGYAKPVLTLDDYCQPANADSILHQWKLDTQQQSSLMIPLVPSSRFVRPLTVLHESTTAVTPADGGATTNSTREDAKPTVHGRRGGRAFIPHQAHRIMPTHLQHVGHGGSSGNSEYSSMSNARPGHDGWVMVYWFVPCDGR